MDQADYSEKINRLIDGADEHFSIGGRPNVVLDNYQQLVVETISAEKAAGNVYFRCNVSPASAGFFINDLSRALISHPELANVRFMALAAEWWRYARSYQQLVERSPLIELENYLGELSESHTQTSWSDDVDLLVPWLDRGAHGTLPINDYHGVLTKRMVNRLLAIRAATGGWLYGFIYGNYFLTDRQLEQLNLNSRGDEVKSFLAEISRTRPSFERL